jgi:hypothetical protein
MDEITENRRSSHQYALNHACREDPRLFDRMAQAIQSRVVNRADRRCRAWPGHVAFTLTATVGPAVKMRQDAVSCGCIVLEHSYMPTFPQLRNV